MTSRWCKIALVFAASSLFAIAATNNIFDYESNFLYVRHILSMDTTFPDNALRWRAIASPVGQHLAYNLIIATELLVGIVCAIGAARLLLLLRTSAEEFNRAKSIAIAGLTLGVLLWFVGFLVIGGEWFLMWQSQDWNAQQPAFRFLGAIALILLFVNAKDED